MEKLTQAETSALIRQAGPKGISLSFGSSGVWLRNVVQNKDAFKQLQAMRDKEQYEKLAHEHDI